MEQAPEVLKPVCVSFNSMLSYFWLQHLWCLVLFLEKSILFQYSLKLILRFPHATNSCWDGGTCQITRLLVSSAGNLSFRSNWELPTTLIYSLGCTELDWPICFFYQTGLLFLNCKSLFLSFPSYTTTANGWDFTEFWWPRWIDYIRCMSRVLNTPLKVTCVLVSVHRTWIPACWPSLAKCHSVLPKFLL